MPQVQQSMTLTKSNEYGKDAALARVMGLNAAGKKLAPYEEYGADSLERMDRLFQDPSYLQETAGYKFALEQGLKGTTAARSRSSIFSGETLKALTEYASGLASKTYNDEWTRLQAGITTGANAAVTGAEIQAGIGEAQARRYDQQTQALAGETGFGKQIFGQWSGAFASTSAASAGSCWVAEVLYGEYNEKTLLTREYVKRHMKDKTILGKFLRAYSKYGKTWAKWVKKNHILGKLVKPIWDALYKQAVKEVK